MQKKQIFAIAVVSLTVLCVAVQVSVGQSQPRWVAQHGPPSGPPSLPSYVAPDVVVASYGMPDTSVYRQAEPAFRVTVIPEVDKHQTRQIAFTPQEEAEEQNTSVPPVPESYDLDKWSGSCQSSDGCAQTSCFGDYGKSCDVKSCGCKGECCCFCVRVYGEYLLLRARDAEVTYAVDANSNEYEMLGPEFPIQVSPFGVLDQDYSSGFRFGFGISVDACSEVAATYTWFDSATSDGIVRNLDTNIPNIVPMTAHPATLDNQSSSVAGVGRHDIGFEMVDVDYRRTFYETGCSEMTYVLGARWGQLEQSFGARYSDDPEQPVNELAVATDIYFNGGGIHLGLEGERTGCCCGVPLIVYAKGFTSLLAGEFDATYTQTGQNGATNMVDTGWSAGRIVPTFDLEVGGGIATPGGRFRATVGYVYSSWNNVVKTEDWLRAVQTNNPKDLGDTMTFDGLVGRIEARF